MNKYHNRRITTPEGTFDSRKEYNRWCELKLLYRAGRITDLERQKRYELVPAQYETVPQYTPVNHIRKADKQVCVERAVTYVADFAYKQGGKEVVEDTKSPATRTKDYIIKRKLMLWARGIKVVEI